ncbi:MAG: tetratricopeptide repeat protein, partial [Proteobacteria bacterium]|nr:tetratricopeptide repeat protein [Pseudomonadota bacterium]
MSIALVVTDRPTENLAFLVRQMLPGVTVQQWPDIADPEAVTLAVLWQHPPGITNDFPNLKAVTSLGAGMDHIIADEAIDERYQQWRIITLSLQQRMAQYVLAYVLQDWRNLIAYQQQQDKSQWQVLETDAGHAGAATVLLAIYEQQEKKDEAIQVLESAVAANPESTALQLRLAQTYLNRKENDKAETIMLGLVRDYPDELQYRVMTASYYSQTDQNDKAEAVLREAIAADPEDAQRYLLLAEFFKNKFGTEKAIAELENSSKAKPELTALQFSLAQLYLQSEQADKAEAI